MRKKKVIEVFLLMLLALMIYFLANQLMEGTFSETKLLAGERIIQENTDRNIEVYFCPQDACDKKIENLISSSEHSIHCALYDVNIDSILNLLDQKKKEIDDVKIVVDDDSLLEREIRSGYFKKDDENQLMHNKFCIFDNKKVLTGSYNPTKGSTNSDNNNIIIIYSETVADNYEKEFTELWQGTYGEGERTINTKILLNNILIETYFCPEDWCANKLIAAINNAERSIFFMAFSFTHKDIGDTLIELQKRGLEVKGVFEKNQLSNYSVYFDFLKNGLLDSRIDTNPKLMHNKVFIIDEKIVATGSFNPSKNADTKNDENLIIIHDEAIAKKYLEEFYRIYDSAK